MYSSEIFSLTNKDAYFECELFYTSNKSIALSNYSIPKKITFAYSTTKNSRKIWTQAEDLKWYYLASYKKYHNNTKMGMSHNFSRNISYVYYTKTRKLRKIFHNRQSENWFATYDCKKIKP